MALAALAAAFASPAAADDASIEAGRQVFTELAEPHCAICHTLADAEAVGRVGPNLDDLKPDEAKVHAAVTGGVGAMPAYADMLSPEQIDAVSKYVAAVVGE